MSIAGKQVIALEEHYYDAEVAATFGGEDRGSEIRKRLDDLGELRIREMDDAGIDMQVLSHGAPSTQRLEGEQAVSLARGANDRLYDAIQRHPDRFAGFAALPTAEPKAAADELERTVTQYGFKGAMVHGLTNGVFFDDKRFWPILERAQALDVPIYLHPAVPARAVVDTYYKDYLQDFPGILTAAWGFTVETATAGIRMVLSGAFDAYPNLKIILGHLGEGLPFLLWRINMALERPGNKSIPFREIFATHFYITTSGNFSTPALVCSMLEMGIDRILYSVDYPYVMNPPGTAWMQDLQVAPEDKEKILSGNAKRLLKL
ncbi:MAG TPA: amidohydrolase family protein [Dehalococcoidia bacterium]|nr:amidohydrolase family protein [Dehalococcoidia bacterium]